MFLAVVKILMVALSVHCMFYMSSIQHVHYLYVYTVHGATGHNVSYDIIGLPIHAAGWLVLKYVH